MPPTNAVPVASDEELASRLAGGDTTAFDELYVRYAKRLSSYGARIVDDRSAGEDVAQTALMNAYRALRRGSTPARVEPWLYRIARNAALQLVARRQERPLDEDRDERPDVDVEERSAARRELLDALRALPERQRRAYLLREVLGLRVPEIARALSLETEQVEQALFAARNRLAELLYFGRRLDCGTVTSLEAHSLGRDGRRALKSHLRACSSCREAGPARVFGLLAPAHLIGLLRGWVGGLFGGGAPVGAKVGAVLAAGVVAASGAPVAAKAIAEKASSVKNEEPTRSERGPLDDSRTPAAAPSSLRPERNPLVYRRRSSRLPAPTGRPQSPRRWTRPIRRRSRRKPCPRRPQRRVSIPRSPRSRL